MRYLGFSLFLGLMVVGCPLWGSAAEFSVAASQAQQAETANATAQDHSHEQAIQDLIEQYRLGYQLADTKALVRVYADFTPALSTALSRYHQVAKNLTVAVENIHILKIDGQEAVTTFTRRDSFIDAQSGKSMQSRVELTKKFIQQDGLWKMLAAAELR